LTVILIEIVWVLLVVKLVLLIILSVILILAVFLIISHFCVCFEQGGESVQCVGSAYMAVTVHSTVQCSTFLHCHRIFCLILYLF